ncbi:putative capsid assembly protein/protease protein [Rhizobium phage RHph_X2_30]|nr:putative capsid assembly protein/protease protein [Rhizobium phage RHph_X2_30]
MPNSVNPLLARFDQAPALVAPEMQGLFEASLRQTATAIARLEADTSKPEMRNGDDDFWFADNDWRSFLRPYHVKDGILQIPIKGVLLHNFPYQYGAYATGYFYIWKAVERGLADGNVKGIALIIDSPGGEVAGNFDLVDKMFAHRGEKPIRAYAMESAYSAAYSIASVADSITVSRTGGVGSIGVVTAHIDASKMVEEIGWKITFIFAGKHKVDGNPYEALSPEVKARIQARIDELYSVFVSTVARNRGMDEKAVRDTEALTFTASQATSNGLADHIGTLDDSVAAFAAELSLDEEDETMSGQTNKDTAVDQAAVESARTEGHAAGKAEGLKEGANTERARISAIVASDEGKKRPTMALKMATGDKFAALDAETVVEMLADMPEEKAATPEKQENATGKNFKEAMDGSENAELGTPGQGESGEVPRHERALAMSKGPRKAA